MAMPGGGQTSPSPRESRSGGRAPDRSTASDCRWAQARPRIRNLATKGMLVASTRSIKRSHAIRGELSPVGSTFSPHINADKTRFQGPRAGSPHRRLEHRGDPIRRREIRARAAPGEAQPRALQRCRNARLPHVRPKTTDRARETSSPTRRDARGWRGARARHTRCSRAAPCQRSRSVEWRAARVTRGARSERTRRRTPPTRRWCSAP